jgi:hypothetical protein
MQPQPQPAATQPKSLSKEQIAAGRAYAGKILWRVFIGVSLIILLVITYTNGFEVKTFLNKLFGALTSFAELPAPFLIKYFDYDGAGGHILAIMIGWSYLMSAIAIFCSLNQWAINEFLSSTEAELAKIKNASAKEAYEKAKWQIMFAVLSIIWLPTIIGGTCVIFLAMTSAMYILEKWATGAGLPPIISDILLSGFRTGSSLAPGIEGAVTLAESKVALFVLGLLHETLATWLEPWVIAYIADLMFGQKKRNPNATFARGLVFVIAYIISVYDVYSSAFSFPNWTFYTIIGFLVVWLVNCYSPFLWHDKLETILKDSLADSKKKLEGIAEENLNEALEIYVYPEEQTLLKKNGSLPNNLAEAGEHKKVQQYFHNLSEATKKFPDYRKEIYSPTGDFNIAASRKDWDRIKELIKAAPKPAAQGQANQNPPPR